MKSPIPPPVIVLPPNPGLQSNMMKTTTEITPRCLPLSPTSRDVSHIWTDASSLITSTSPGFFNLNSETPENLNTLTQTRSFSPAKKSLAVTKAHPYFSHSSKLSKLSHRRYSTHRKPDEKGNSFLEGFSDCASEVLRFLREVECVEDSNPLLQGLQSHLSKVRYTICPENVTDSKDVKHETDSSDPDNHPVPVTHIISQSPVEVPSCIDSYSSLRSELTHVSVSKPNDILVSTSSHSDPNKLICPIDTLKHLVFPNCHDNSLTASTYPTQIHIPLTSPSDMIPVSLSNVSSMTKYSHSTLDNAGCSNRLPVTGQLNLRFSQMHTTQSLHVLSSSRIDQPNSMSSSLPPNANIFSQALNFLPTASSSVQDQFMSNSQSKDVTNKSLVLNKLPEQLKETRTDSITSHHSSHIVSPLQSSLDYKRTDILQTIDPVVSWCLEPPVLSASTLNMLSSQPLSLPISQTNYPLIPTNLNESQPKTDAAGIVGAVPTELDNEQLTNLVLELKPNSLPGVPSSSVASGNFGDVLLAVESCRGHNDSRVRALAEELIYLIHNDEDISSDGEEDDDIDGSEDNFSEDEVHGEDQESGIEMDDSWSNAADLIEQ